MDKVKVGIIGCGNFAKSQHLPNCVDADNIELWCCNVQSEEERKTAESFGPQKITSDYRELLNDPEVDMVILAVPHGVHAFFIEETIKAGKNLLCEKPMAMSMDESYRIIKGVREKGLKLCVDYNRRFSPSMIDMKQAYHAHKNGKRNKPRVFTQEDNRPIWAEEEKSSILIRINDESLTYGGVHIDWKDGGGLVIGEGCHWLDLMCWLLEDRPVRITGIGSTRLDYIINIEFASGSLGCIFFSSHGSFEYPKELIEIQDHGKIFRSECFVENQYFGLGDRIVKKFPLQCDFFPEIGTQGGLSGLLEKNDATGKEFVEKGLYRYCGVDKGWRRLLQTFATAIIDNDPSPIDELQGMRATYLSLRAMESIRSGVSLPINIEDWDMYVD
jgi:predicted dehydrogenase